MYLTLNSFLFTLIFVLGNTVYVWTQFSGFKGNAYHYLSIELLPRH